ncbi:MAG: transcription antitermination factor NusB [Clostridia bacterium]|nr:transcription antitermination factor NusB [Clostridia bacterium]
MRAQARTVAFNVIYINLFEDKQDADAFDFLCQEEHLKAKEIEFATEILNAYFDNKNEIHNSVQNVVTGYKMQRVYKIDLALIYLAVAEIKFVQTPKSIVINEVLELAKTYSTEKSSSFINGVLAKID